MVPGLWLKEMQVTQWRWWEHGDVLHDHVKSNFHNGVHYLSYAQLNYVNKLCLSLIIHPSITL